MHTWLLITVVSTSVAAALSLLLLLRRFLSPPPSTPPPNSRTSPLERERAESLQTGIAKLHHINIHHQIDIENDQKRPNFHLFRPSQKTLFSWSDHPSLVTDAVENGWSRFAFSTPYTSSQSIRSSKTQSFLGPCGGGGGGGKEERETGVEITWEVSPGYADFMQKIKLNSGFNKKYNNINLVSVIKTVLPLPGPPQSFPQEAYFEITVLKTEGIGEGQFGNLRCESEKAKLIQQNSSAKGGSESIAHVISSVHGNNTNSNNNNNNRKLEGLKNGGVLVSIGLVRGGPIPLKIPGSFPGSVGFNSDGSVFLDGLKLVLESQKHEWRKPDKVIGCGYNPIQKRVFFTLDSQLVHVISCKTEEFGTPLYPTLAANADVTVLVNFGQSAFKYLPANSQRTPNPCFIGPLAHSPTFGYEDSRELFSMGRIDSQWLNRSATRNSVSNYGGNNKFGIDYDDESEGDLFEIVLAEGKSPNLVLR